MGKEFQKEFHGTFYYQKKLKWYQKIWYFIIRKENPWEKLGPIKELTVEKG